MAWTLLTALLLVGVQVVYAAPQQDTAVSSVSITVSTVVATIPTAQSSLPTQVPLPPLQPWCPSKIFCAGQLLQTVNIAQLYTDPKTFVDKPTNKSSTAVLQDFAGINGSKPTFQQVLNFVDTDFKGEGLELEAVQLANNFDSTPAFLDNVTDPLVKSWTSIVHSYWTQLIRGTNDSVLCAVGTCESTLIPLNHTFVVPGGRFREQYYWDSFWIVEGLIQSELYSVVNSTLQNFMDELEKYGFIPNGGRTYYLNRSQPPLFIRMLSLYINATKDTSILSRALPLAETELKWWLDNRTLNVTSSYTGKTYAMSHFAVNNTAPRPESYLTDYLTANNGTDFNEDQRSALYAELASGAESGWDYTVRFSAQPFSGNSTDTNPILRSLDVRQTIPICLNSILYKSHLDLADLYIASGNNSSVLVDSHRSIAASLKAGILDLFWDSSKVAFYDYNLTSNARNTIYTTATFYPLWSGIIPDEILMDASKAFGFFAGINLVLNRYNGTFPTTFITTGLQWDAPNAWPPHQYIALAALRALPSNVTSSALPTPQSGQSTFSLVPSGQFGLSEDQLPLQSILGAGNASTTGSRADINTLPGTVVNGGNSTPGEGWSQTLQREFANRYIAAAFCSWYATGGSIPNVLPRRPDYELNVTNSVNNTGNMFEKFSNVDIDSSGRGGEYEVQAGFGWTNGVVLWVASTYGNILAAPQCPDLIVTSTVAQSAGLRLTVPSFCLVIGVMLAAASVFL